MKYKRNKATRRTLGFFGINFGFRPPFQIICTLFALGLSNSKLKYKFNLVWMLQHL